MSARRAFWFLRLGIMTVPYLLLLGAGALWLHERGYLLWWLALSGALVLVARAGLLLARARARHAPAPAGGAGTLKLGEVNPNPAWSRAGREAWERVGAIAARVATPGGAPATVAAAQDLALEILETVARVIHPRSRDPILEISLPNFLLMLERASGELRETLLERVPGSHLVTIAHLRLFQRAYPFFREGLRAWRVLRVLVNPKAALAGEMVSAVGGESWGDLAGEIRAEVAAHAVRMLGRQAIDLYSLRPLAEGELEEFLSARSRRDLARARAGEEARSREPLRILVLGQVNAGKSSLINALLREPRAAVDALPRTATAEVYRAGDERFPNALFHDTPGYGGGEDERAWLERSRQEILACDMLLLALSARSASRAPDRALLDRIRALFLEEPRRPMPATIAILTHADAIRPAGEWAPPYDLARAGTPKAANLRDAVTLVRGDLALGEEQEVIPVSLRPGHAGDVGALLDAIGRALPGARGARRARCLPEFRRADSVRRLGAQIRGGTRALIDGVTGLVRRRSRRIGSADRGEDRR